MKNNHALKLGLLLLLIFVLFLSGCSSDPSLTFEQMAKWQGEEFVSEFGGFSVEAPENWLSLSDSEIKEQVVGMDNVIYGTPEVSLNELRKTSGVYPMILMTEAENALGEASFASIFVVFERLGSLAKLSVKTPDKYLEVLKQGYLEESEAEFDYSFEDVYSATIGGVEYRCLPIKVGMFDVDQVFAVRIKDDFVIGLIFTATSNHVELIDDAIAAFSIYP